MIGVVISNIFQDRNKSLLGNDLHTVTSVKAHVPGGRRYRFEGERAQSELINPTDRVLPILIYLRNDRQGGGIFENTPDAKASCIRKQWEPPRTWT